MIPAVVSKNPSGGARGRVRSLGTNRFLARADELIRIDGLIDSRQEENCSNEKRSHVAC